MEQTIQEVANILNSFTTTLNEIDEHVFSAKPVPGKWSKKEVLGHLIDSAHNNLRRFIATQYELEPRIFYDQDFWVRANGYQAYAQTEIIELWRLVNGQIINVLRNMPPENYSKECNTASKDVMVHPLQWLAGDYIKHMKHHLNQIVEGSFDVIYP